MGYQVMISYDAMDRVVRIADEDGDFTYDYNLAGLLSSSRDSEGNVIRLNYDETGKLTSISQPMSSKEEFGFEYDRLGQLNALFYPNGIKAIYKYDSVGNNVLEKFENQNGSIIYHRETEYDLSDNPIRVKDSKGKIWKYSYDKLDRLIDAKTPWNRWIYAYDAIFRAVNSATTYIHHSTEENKQRMLRDARRGGGLPQARRIIDPGFQPFSPEPD